MRAFFRQLRPAFAALAVFTVVTGVAYPLVVWAVGTTALHARSEGSLVVVDGRVVGSSLIGQQFTSPQYFHPRPSAAGDGYDGSRSSGSNLGPNNAVLLDQIASRVIAFREENGLSADVKVPVDAVTASASGLDPHISIANARLQAPRVAAARRLDVGDVLRMVDEHTDAAMLSILGDDGVNVMALNLALDDLQH